jgi:hypothetical protein
MTDLSSAIVQRRSPADQHAVHVRRADDWGLGHAQPDRC